MENFGVNFSDQKVEDFQIVLPPVQGNYFGKSK